MICFETENGSTYRIDGDAMTWARLHRTNYSGGIRAERGELIVLPQIAVGKPTVLLDTSIVKGFSAHAVVTSPVVSVWTED